MLPQGLSHTSYRFGTHSKQSILFAITELNNSRYRLNLDIRISLLSCRPCFSFRSSNLISASTNSSTFCLTFISIFSFVSRLDFKLYSLVAPWNEILRTAEVLPSLPLGSPKASIPCNRFELDDFLASFRLLVRLDSFFLTNYFIFNHISNNF